MPELKLKGWNQIPPDPEDIPKKISQTSDELESAGTHVTTTILSGSHTHAFCERQIKLRKETDRTRGDNL